MTDLELWYSKPAAVWTEALPLGNGRLGAMVFGDVSRERLQINESTFYSGGPYAPLNPRARGSLEEVRRLIFAGRYAEAEELSYRDMMAEPYLQMSYQPIGDVWINFHHGMNAVDYRRSLDLDSAISTTRYAVGGVTYLREALISAVDGVFGYRVSADRPGAVHIDIGMSSPQPGEMEGPGRDTISFAGTNRREHGVEGALRFRLAARVAAEGGSVTTSGDTLRVRNADSATILIDAATSFRRYDDVSGDPSAATAARLDAAGGRSWEEMRRDHVADHRKLFRALSIDLGPSAQTSTDERIRRYASGGDPGLASLFVQYGRYLTIASSRSGTQPSNLQGIWNEETRPPWGSKHTTNINLQMNYWLPDPANLSACFEPLIALVEDVAETGRETARVHYGARGWVLHHNTDLWRATGPVDGPQWGLWPTGGAWLCAQLWDHYQFAPDPELLARIYPLLRGSAEFLLHFLVEEPGSGRLVTAPSLSPENKHPHGASLCAAPAMDNQILRDLFSAVIEAAETLGVDAELSARLAAALPRLHPDRIGGTGQLQEWVEDWDLEAPERHHRHVSHLYGLYPSQQISIDRTPALAAAVRRSLELRGDEATGWGIGWRINLWARLGDGERAANVVRLLLSPDRTYPNMFDAHPPFQIDGNFGGAAGIIEMLVQSRPGRITILPALPSEWPSGRIEGVRVRGGGTIALQWQPAGVRVTLSADRPFSGMLVYGGAEVAVALAAGESLTHDFTVAA